MRRVVFAVVGLALGIGACALGLVFTSPLPRRAVRGHALRPGLPVVTAEAAPDAPARSQRTPRAAGGVTSGSAVRLPPSGTQEAGTGFWLTKSSGTRHNNAKCRYDETSNGRPCGPTEGRACRVCGG